MKNFQDMLAPSIPLTAYMQIHTQRRTLRYHCMGHWVNALFPSWTAYIDTLHLIQATSFTYVIIEYQYMKRKQLGFVKTCVTLKIKFALSVYQENNSKQVVF